MYQCKTCNKIFKTGQALCSHQKVHKEGYINKGYLAGAGKYVQDSKQHRIQLYYQNPICCLYCNSALTYQQHKDRTKYCSRSCAAIANNAKRYANYVPTPKTIYSSKPTPTPNTIKNCKHCNTPFKGWTLTKFCSPTCRQLYKDAHPRIITDAMRLRFRQGGQRSAEVQQQTKRSVNETLFFNMCKSEFLNVTNNERYFNGWDADIIIHDIKIAILWNGVWHYKKITEKHSVSQVQNRDNIKIKEITKLRYIPYIIKDMGRPGKQANIKFVEDEYKKFKKWIHTTKNSAP